MRRGEVGKQDWMRELAAAVEAAARGDVKAEEEAFQRAERIAVELIAKSWLGGPKKEFLAEVQRLHDQGLIRQCEPVGSVGEFRFFSDRIVTGDGSVVLPDAQMKASVETAGSLSPAAPPVTLSEHVDTYLDAHAVGRDSKTIDVLRFRLAYATACSGICT